MELIARADTRGLAAIAPACLDRRMPLLDGDDEVLSPLWEALADDTGAPAGPDRAYGLARARDKLAGPDARGEDEAVLPARRMPAAAPAECSGPALRVWADACSAASLRIHRLLDPAVPPGPAGPEARAPLVAAEPRRQVAVPDVLAAHGPAGPRPAREVSTEGRRVLRAVVSRRARGRV